MGRPPRELLLKSLAWRGRPADAARDFVRYMLDAHGARVFDEELRELTAVYEQGLDVLFGPPSA